MSEDALKIREETIKEFCKEGNDEIVLSSNALKIISELPIDYRPDADEEGDYKYIVNGKCFVGVNVRTSSKQKIRPIKFMSPENEDYTSNPDEVDGKITDLGNARDEALFQWDPDKGIIDGLASETMVELFKSEFGPSGKKYNILGDIYNKALKIEGRKPCWVWIRLFDFDIYNGAASLSFVLSVCEKKKDIIIVQDHSKDILSYIMLTKARYVRQLEKERQVESMKTAVASIMSRNMSHNLGSHYLYYTKNQLSKLADSHGEIGPEIRGAAKVLGYMQARMDYLATIVSEDKYPYGSVYFKGQIFDELTIDDFSRRHFSEEFNSNRRTVNYLLRNLIMSENFTREPVYKSKEQFSESNEQPQSTGNKTVHLQVKTKLGMFNKKNGDQSNAEAIKLDFSKICIALPGGIMSIHAFFNVLENFIRNSAKYLKEDFKDEGLVFTIVINELGADKKNKLPIRYEFVIFDNKANANRYIAIDDDPKKSKKLVDWMNEQLCSMKFLTESNELDKHSKGLKEMLFSTLWMRAYSWMPAYADDSAKRMADKLVELDDMTGEKKALEIKRHAFEFVAVNDNGKEASFSLFGKNIPNLGIRFELPKYRMLENVEAKEMENNMKEIGLYNFRDVVCVYFESEKGESNEEGRKESLDDFAKRLGLRFKFTRVYLSDKAIDENNDKEASRVLRSVLRERFKDFDSYRVGMAGKKHDADYEEGFTIEKGIFFERHASEVEKMDNFPYCEAISGDNFTDTMYNIFHNGFRNGKIDESNEYFVLKIKESALTRITLIDERFYKDMVATKDKSEYLRLKNIRVLNLKDVDSAPDSFIDMFEGNHFTDNTETENGTHFLSIHLGMIEKIVKNKSLWVIMNHLEKSSMSVRVNTLMNMLRETFKMPNGELFISVHSGRGNFSPQLDDSLKGYPFISISAIESVYSNSKFLLAQLFYNTVYIGKGEINNNKAD